MKKIEIGQTVNSKYGMTKIIGIEMVSPNAIFPDDDDNIPMTEIFECDKDRCVFDLDNNHWSWGINITILKPETV